MKRVVIDNEQAAIEYIEMVLSEWKQWHTHHTALVKALEILLSVHKSKSEALRLKCEYINEVKECVNELHKKVSENEQRD